MKATKAMLNLVEKCKSKSDLDGLLETIQAEKDLRPSEMGDIKSALVTKFNESRTRFVFQVRLDKRGRKWLNLYRQTKGNDGTFGEINRFSKKMFNVQLDEAEASVQQLSASIGEIVANARKSEVVSD